MRIRRKLAGTWEEGAMGRASRRVVILVAAGVLAASLGGVPATGGAAAAPAAGQAPAVTPNPGLLDNVLTGVSAVSGSDAWAVGYYHTATGAYKTLILHWNGRAWSKVKSPNPSQGGVGLDELFGVSAVSGSDAWAVGEYTGFPANAYDTLILHWNGTAWTQVKSPNPSSCPGTECGINVLDGVSALSGRSAWAVGEYQNSDGVTLNSLVLRWNGTAWKQVSTPNVPKLDRGLDGVSAVSGSDAWAVGTEGVLGSAFFSTLIMHWNGRAWSLVKSPSPGSAVGENFLRGVSAVSGSDVWAAGSYAFDLNNPNPNEPDTLILHWNGKAWTQVKTPNPSSTFNELNGVSALSGSDAWAVGDYLDRIGQTKTLILRWNGTAWTQVKSPNPSCPDAPGWDNLLNGVSALSGSDAWAAGDYLDCSGAVAGNATLVAHWNGTAWANASVIRTSTSVSSSANPVTTGKAVTYTARVAPAPVSNLGWVAFYDNGSLISSCRHRALRSGKATCTVTYASAGSHAIKAAYPGYADYGRSTSPRLTETVRR
jgi:Bacterial Ig-like domain (group 3)